jgi:hypothetical protein
MDGTMNLDPKPKAEMVNGSKVMDDQGQPMEGLEGMAHGGSGHVDPSKHHHGGDAMEVDSRSNARGQTEDQIRAQEKKIHETVSGLWTKNKS